MNWQRINFVLFLLFTVAVNARSYQRRRQRRAKITLAKPRRGRSEGAMGMSDWRDDTPLGPSIRPWLKDQQGIAMEPLIRSKELLNRGLATLSELDVPIDSLREVIVSTLWARCLEHYEAVIVLLERGMVTPAWVSARALIETLFTLGAIVQDDRVVQQYLEDDQVQRRKLLRKLRAVSNPHFSGMADPQLERQLDEEIKKSGARQLSTEFLAEKAGLKDWYLVAYALMTGPAHTKVRDLQRYLKIGQASVDFEFPRRDVDVRGILSTAGIAFLLAFSRVEELFRRGLGNDRDPYLKYFFELGNTAGDEAAADDV